jgi:anaerobic glycerol-3-phosphate dehydrogenase
MHLILYSKIGCHLCAGLEAKLRQLPQPAFDLEVREITTRPDWWEAFQYEIPVLHLLVAGQEQLLPRPSPRATLLQLQQMLERYLPENDAQ